MITRRHFHRWSLATGLSTLGFGLLAGCEQRQKIDPASSAGIQDVVIGMISKAKSNPVFLAAQRGAETRAAELTEAKPGTVTLDYRTPVDEDPQKQAEFLEQLVAVGVHGIAVACSDADKLASAIDRAIESGVEVMCFDSDAPTSNRLAYVGTDDRAAGEQVMNKVGELVGQAEGKVALLAGNQTATNLQKRVNGAIEAAKKFPNLTLLDSPVYHKETPADALTAVESVQKANPDIIAWGFLGGWPLMTDRPMPWEPGAVTCVSMDTLPVQLEHLRTGNVQVLLGQQYFYFGQQCINVLVDKIRHEKVPAQEVDFAPLDVVSQENVDEYAKNWEKWK